MWDPKQDGFSYADSENMLIISPFVKHESLYKVKAIPIGTEGCPLDGPWRVAIEYMDACHIYTGYWELPHRPSAILLDLRGSMDEILDRCLDLFCAENSMAIPHDDRATLSAIAFGYKVADLVKLYYARIDRFHSKDLLVDSKNGSPLLRIHFHDWITGPALLFLRRHFFMDFAEFTFIVYNPILGSFKPTKPGDADYEAARLGVGYKYGIERDSALFAHHVRSKAPIQNKLIKRQLIRGPDVLYVTKAEREKESVTRNLESYVLAHKGKKELKNG